jgi:hypothetical protein
MIRHVIGATALALSIGTANAERAVWDDPKLRPILAATMFLGVQYAPLEQVGIANEHEGHIGNVLEVDQTDDECAWSVSKPGPNGPFLSYVNFSKLSGETTGHFGAAGYANVTFLGVGEAACYFDSRGRKSCEDHVTVTVKASELRTAVRALRYIHSHVCQPAEILF